LLTYGLGLAAPPAPLACCAALCAVPLPLRYIVQALPVLLVSGILVVMSLTRCIQIVQQRVFRVLPFGALGSMTLSDICVGILISGLFMLYFGEHITVCCFSFVPRDGVCSMCVLVCPQTQCG
jgi:hypothetical protein